MDFNVKKTKKELSQRQLEGYERYSSLIQWGRKNPVMFCEYMLGIEFMDYQRYVFMNSWSKTFCLWVMSRNAGKSTLIAPINMTKLLLFPNFTSYILSITAAQSADTFSKMEKIAKKQIESFTGLTDFYLGEIVPSANSDGFTHSTSGFKFSLYNGSQTTSLAGVEDNIRGKRSNLNIYDE